LVGSLPPRELLDGALIDPEPDLWGGLFLVFQVSQPDLDLLRMKGAEPRRSNGQGGRAVAFMGRKQRED